MSWIYGRGIAELPVQARPSPRMPLAAMLPLLLAAASAVIDRAAVVDRHTVTFSHRDGKPISGSATAFSALTVVRAASPVRGPCFAIHGRGLWAVLTMDACIK